MKEYIMKKLNEGEWVYFVKENDQFIPFLSHVFVFDPQEDIDDKDFNNEYYIVLLDDKSDEWEATGYYDRKYLMTQEEIAQKLRT